MQQIKLDANTSLYDLAQILRGQFPVYNGVFNNTLVQLHQSFIRIKVEDDQKSDLGDNRIRHNIRVLLSANNNDKKYVASTLGKLSYQCNGAVLLCQCITDYENNVIVEPQWEVLAHPPPRIAQSEQHYRQLFTQLVELNAAKSYEIMPMQDGTSVTLYFYDSQWRMASANGYDITDFSWKGGKTFKQMLIEAAGQKKGQPTLFDRLNPNYCYSVGFHHRDIHPLHGDTQRAWLIQVVDPRNGTLLSEQQVGEAIGIPTQKSTTLIGTPVEIMRVFNNHLKENAMAFRQYIDKVKTNRMPASDEICYGFILKGSYEAHGEFACVGVKSSLMTRIKNMIYNVSKQAKTSSNLDLYMSLNAYLDHNNRTNFALMFPSLSNLYYPKIKDLLLAIQGHILNGCRNKDYKLRLSRAGSAIEKFAYSNLSQFEITEKINPFDSSAGSIIGDYLCNKEYIQKYHDIISAQ